MGRGGVIEASMSRNPTEKPVKQPTAADRRQQRLAEALRSNLKRRKAAGRTQETNTAGKPADDGE
jgi:hypothetical protein